MKKLLLLLLSLSGVFAVPARAQNFQAVLLMTTDSDPTTNCTHGPKFWINSTTNRMFTCYAGVWHDFEVDPTPTTFPLLAPNGCTTIPYGFSDELDLGLCRDGSGTLRLRNGPDNVMNSTWIGPEGNLIRSKSYGAGGVTDTDWLLGGGAEALTTGQSTGVRVFRSQSSNQFRVSNPGATVQSFALTLNNTASNTYLRFDDIVTPANSITYSKNVNTPSTTNVVTNGANTITEVVDASAPSQTTTVSSGTGTATLTQAPSSVNANVTDGSNTAIVVITPALMSNSVTDGVSTAEYFLTTAGFHLPYGGSLASAATISPKGNVFHVTGTTNIDTIAIDTAGTCITLIFDDVLTVGDLTGNINLPVAFVSTANDTLSLCTDGTTWFYVSSGVN